MPLGIDFWKDFGGFWMPKRGKVESKMGSKIDVNFERRLLYNRALPAAVARFFEIRGSKVGAKMKQKAIKK